MIARSRARTTRARRATRPCAAAPAVLLAALAAAPGCSPGEREPEPAQEGRHARTDLPPATEAPRPLTPDEKLAEDVRRALLQAPALAQEDIRIAAAQGLVVLAGTVSAPHLRDEAVQIAGQVPGVVRVQSKLAVGRR